MIIQPAVAVSLDGEAQALHGSSVLSRENQEMRRHFNKLVAVVEEKEGAPPLRSFFPFVARSTSPLVEGHFLASWFLIHCSSQAQDLEFSRMIYCFQVRDGNRRAHQTIMTHLIALIKMFIV